MTKSQTTITVCQNTVHKIKCILGQKEQKTGKEKKRERQKSKRRQNIRNKGKRIKHQVRWKFKPKEKPRITKPDKKSEKLRVRLKVKYKWSVKKCLQTTRNGLYNRKKKRYKIFPKNA